MDIYIYIYIMIYLPYTYEQQLKCSKPEYINQLSYHLRKPAGGGSFKKAGLVIVIILWKYDYGDPTGYKQAIVGEFWKSMNLEASLTKHSLQWICVGPMWKIRP